MKRKPPSLLSEAWSAICQSIFHSCLRSQSLGNARDRNVPRQGCWRVRLFFFWKTRDPAESRSANTVILSEGKKDPWKTSATFDGQIINVIDSVGRVPSAVPKGRLLEKRNRRLENVFK